MLESPAVTGPARGRVSGGMGLPVRGLGAQNGTLSDVYQGPVGEEVRGRDPGARAPVAYRIAQGDPPSARTGRPERERRVPGRQGTPAVRRGADRDAQEA